jgi:hypothetical protein
VAYIAWRAHTAGGILLVGLAAVWLGFLIYNMTLEPMDPVRILSWLGFIACPLIGGLLFFRLGKKK